MRARAFARRDNRIRISRVRPCATCKGSRSIHELDPYAGFCTVCLDRSRTHDGDDLGGEC